MKSVLVEFRQRPRLLNPNRNARLTNASPTYFHRTLITPPVNTHPYTSLIGASVGSILRFFAS